MTVTVADILFTCIFFLGLIIGSFLNVVIHRLPLGESVVFPRSHCPKCRSLIPWYRNFPIISFCVQLGRCANCKAKISWRYPLVELLTTILFCACAWLYPSVTILPFYFYFIGAAIASTFIDLDHWIIPDKITLPGILIGFVSSFFIPDMDWINSLIGLLFGGGILFLIDWIYHACTGRDGIGGGDMKYLAMVGAFVGFKGTIVTLIVSSMIGSVFGLVLILIQKRSGRTAIPYGPFLALGSLSALFFGPTLWKWYFGLH